MLAIIEQVGILKKETEILKKNQIRILDLNREVIYCKTDKKTMH